MLVSELFKEFYAPTHHSESAYYLFFGLHGKTALLPWIWTAITLNIIATVILTFHKLRNNFKVLLPSIQEQTKIANFLSSIDTKIEKAQKQLEKTKEFKKALLQTMFV